MISFLILNLQFKKNYLIAKKPSKQSSLETVQTSENPALFKRSKFPWVENGSNTPIRLLAFPMTSDGLKLFSLKFIKA